MLFFGGLAMVAFTIYFYFTTFESGVSTDRPDRGRLVLGFLRVVDQLTVTVEQPGLRSFPLDPSLGEIFTPARPFLHAVRISCIVRTSRLSAVDYIPSERLEINSASPLIAGNLPPGRQ